MAPSERRIDTISADVGELRTIVADLQAVVVGVQENIALLTQRADMHIDILEKLQLQLEAARMRLSILEGVGAARRLVAVEDRTEQLESNLVAGGNLVAQLRQRVEGLEQDYVSK